MVSTAGVARNAGGAYFVAKRKPSKNLDACWEFPGGKAGADETPEAALQREYKEEFGIDIEVGNLFCTGSFSNRAKDFTLMAFRIRLLGSPECREHLEFGWKSLDEIQRLNLVPSDRIILEKLLKNRN